VTTSNLSPYTNNNFPLVINCATPSHVSSIHTLLPPLTTSTHTSILLLISHTLTHQCYHPPLTTVPKSCYDYKDLNPVPVHAMLCTFPEHCLSPYTYDSNNILLLLDTPQPLHSFNHIALPPYALPFELTVCYEIFLCPVNISILHNT
jgi:hypothetical protein